MEGISLDFQCCFKALNNNLEARLFYMFIFKKLGTVLTYAFKLIIVVADSFKIWMCFSAHFALQIKVILICQRDTFY